MKLAMALVVLAFSGYANAAATIRIPLVIVGEVEFIPAAEINAKLKAIGKPTIPETFEISSTDDYDAVLEKLDRNNKIVEQAGRDLGVEISRQSELTAGENNTKIAKTCYLGQPKDVVKAIQAAIDLYYSDQLNIWGYKYKSKTVYADNSVDAEELENLLVDGSKNWKNWRGKGDAVLILSAYTDDGDDVNESIISKCRN